MSTRNDSESLHEPTEQTALLGDDRSHVEDDRSVRSDAESTPQEPEARPRSWYAWRIFWAVIAIVVIGVFVKGWIDADETEVMASDSDFS